MPLKGKVGKMVSSEEAKTGLELDKLELPDTLGAPVSNTSGYRGVQRVAEKKALISKKALFKVLFLISGVVLFFSIILFLWDQGVVDVPLLASQKVRRNLERYATVGPVMTSIGKDKHIKLMVKIECRNIKLKERLTEIESALRNKILMVLNTPEAKEILSRRDYQSLKPYFEKAVSGLVKKGSIKHIYFSEITQY